MCYSVLIEQDLKSLELHFEAKVDQEAFARFHDLTQKEPKVFRPISAHSRIYPYYFAPVLVQKRGQKVILPMRYRLRPAGSSEEIPNRYNLYNARIDGLNSRKTWKSLFGKHHGLLAFRGFYEWVTDSQSGKKKVVFFKPQNHGELITTPILYDIWTSPDHGYGSFAIITGEPPSEVEEMGHDRCPVPIPKKDWETWLHPENVDREHLTKMLYRSESQINLVGEDAKP